MAGALRKTMEYLGLSEPTEDAFGTNPQASDEVEERPTPRVLTPIPRVVSVHPTTYNEARQIGEAFRDGIPVIMNLTGMGEAEAKRMVDFSAGLVFGLHGVIERVTNRVFLLSPATVHVESDSREPEERSRFFNQG